MRKIKLILFTTAFFCLTTQVVLSDSQSKSIQSPQKSTSLIRHYDKNTQLSIEIPDSWKRLKPDDDDIVMFLKNFQENGNILFIQSLKEEENKYSSIEMWANSFLEQFKAKETSIYDTFLRKWIYLYADYSLENNENIPMFAAITEQFNVKYAFFFLGPNLDFEQVKPILDSLSFFHPAPPGEPEYTVVPTPTPEPTALPQDIWDKAFSSAKNGDFETGISLLETIQEESELAQKSKIKIQEWRKILDEKAGKKAFEQAMQLATKKDYFAAIEQLKNIPNTSSFYQKGQAKFAAWRKIIVEKEGKDLFSKAINAASSGDFKSAIFHAENISTESSYYQKSTEKKLQWQKILSEKAARSDLSGLNIQLVGVPDDLAEIFKKYKYELVKALKSRPDEVDGLYLPATLIIDFKKEEPIFTFWVNADRKSFQIVKEQGYTFIHHFGIYWLMGSVQYWYQALVNQLYEGSDEEKEICRKYCRKLNPIANTLYSIGLYTSKDSYFRQYSRTNSKGNDAIFSNQVEVKLPNQKPVFIAGRKLNGTGRKSFVFVMPELNSHNKAVYSFFGVK